MIWHNRVEYIEDWCHELAQMLPRAIRGLLSFNAPGPVAAGPLAAGRRGPPAGLQAPLLPCPSTAGADAEHRVSMLGQNRTLHGFSCLGATGERGFYTHLVVLRLVPLHAH